METIVLPVSITVFYIEASAFPAGIEEAHEKLLALVPFPPKRKRYGLSRPENSTIQYKAAAEELQPGEAEKFHCKKLILSKGKYICLTVNNYHEDVLAIGNAFKELLSRPGLDPQGYCVEWYKNEKDVQCMVRLAG